MTVLVSKPALNLREELSALNKPTGIAGAAMLAADTVAEQQALLGVGRRNWIINGDCRISQRGNYVSATSATNSVYYLDRWKTNAAGVASTVQQLNTNQPESKPFSNSIRYTASSSASGYIGCLQVIEDYQKLKGQTVTLSAWVKSSGVNVHMYIYSGGAYVGKGTVNTPNGEWQKLKFTGVINSSGSTVGVYLVSTTSDDASQPHAIGSYIEFTEVQLELGKVATPFEHRSYGEELALCRRYFITSATSTNSGVSFGHTTGGGQWLYTTLESQVLSKMRSAPTVSYSGATGTWTTALSYGVYYAKDTIYAYHESSGAQADVYGNVYWTADSEL